MKILKILELEKREDSERFLIIKTSMIYQDQLKISQSWSKFIQKFLRNHPLIFNHKFLESSRKSFHGIQKNPKKTQINLIRPDDVNRSSIMNKIAHSRSEREQFFNYGQYKSDIFSKLYQSMNLIYLRWRKYNYCLILVDYCPNVLD